MSPMEIAVVIPALNERERIEACVRSVLAQAPATEVLVVDGGSTDGTAEIARGCARVAASRRGRARQMNEGARRTSGELLLFLHADTVLHPQALGTLLGKLADPAAVGGTFSLRFDSEHPLLRMCAFFTRFGPALFHYGDQGIFVRRTVFEQLGGFDENLPIMEDVDFLRRMRRSGRTLVVRRPVTTSARRFEAHGMARQQVLNGLLLALYHVGAEPEKLARWYDGALAAGSGGIGTRA